MLGFELSRNSFTCSKDGDVRASLKGGQQRNYLFARCTYSNNPIWTHPCRCVSQSFDISNTGAAVSEVRYSRAQVVFSTK